MTITKQADARSEFIYKQHRQPARISLSGKPGKHVTHVEIEHDDGTLGRIWGNYFDTLDEALDDFHARYEKLAEGDDRGDVMKLTESKRQIIADAIAAGFAVLRCHEHVTITKRRNNGTVIAGVHIRDGIAYRLDVDASVAKAMRSTAEIRSALGLGPAKA